MIHTLKLLPTISELTAIIGTSLVNHPILCSDIEQRDETIRIMMNYGAKPGSSGYCKQMLKNKHSHSDWLCPFISNLNAGEIEFYCYPDPPRKREMIPYVDFISAIKDYELVSEIDFSNTLDELI